MSQVESIFQKKNLLKSNDFWRKQKFQKEEEKIKEAPPSCTKQTTADTALLCSSCLLIASVCNKRKSVCGWVDGWVCVCVCVSVSVSVRASMCVCARLCECVCVRVRACVKEKEREKERESERERESVCVRARVCGQEGVCVCFCVCVCA